MFNWFSPTKEKWKKEHETETNLHHAGHFRGICRTECRCRGLYPQLQDLDFTTQAARLDVPVYFFEGRKDVNAMTSLVEHYYRMLQAPHKELIWSSSGHGIAGADPKQVVDVMVNHVLKQTWPGR